MALIRWDKQLETGIAVIDKQHRHWVELINALGVAVAEGREEVAIRKTVDELNEYSSYHFRTEEALMERAGYDAEELSLHKREHQVFTDQVVIFKDRLAIGAEKLSPRVIEYMYDWLVTHITASDRGYIAPIREAGIAGE